MTRDYAVSLQIAEPRTIAAVHARLPCDAVPRSFGRYLDQVYAAAKSGVVELDGENVFVYHDVPGRPGEADVAFGVGITAPFAMVGNVRPTLLPVGEVATTTHWGDYAQLGAAHRAVVEWCRARGRRPAGARWEVYGHWVEGKTPRTDVFHLLEPGG